MNLNIAIISPNRDAYSESFIQAHRKLRGNVFYYYGGHIPNHLDGQGRLGDTGRVARFFQWFDRRSGKVPNFRMDELRLLQSLKENKIDVVLAEYGTTGAAILPVCRYAGIPMVVHFHGYDASRVDVILQNRERYIAMFSYAKVVIAVSRRMVADLLQLGCPEHKICLNTYAPNDDFFRIQVSKRRKHFLAIGRFVNKKAPYLTIAAFSKVVAAYPSARLVMVGEGELMQVCKHLVRFFGIEGQVHFAGVQDRRSIVSLMSDAIAFVQHSVVAEDGDSEGTPVAIIEALAAGLPVISTKHAGIPDVVTDGHSGLLVEEGDIEGMAKAMMRLLADAEEGPRLGYNGREFVKSKLRMDAHLHKIEEVLALATMHEN